MPDRRRGTFALAAGLRAGHAPTRNLRIGIETTPILKHGAPDIKAGGREQEGINLSDALRPASGGLAGIVLVDQRDHSGVQIAQLHAGVGAGDAQMGRSLDLLPVRLKFPFVP